MDDRCPSKDPLVVHGRLREDPKALAMIVPGLGVVFISRDKVSIATDEEIRRGC